MKKTKELPTKTIVLVAVLLLAATSFAQEQEKERARTKQCRAELTIWYKDSIVKQYANAEKQTPSIMGSLPIDGLVTRKNEMEFCSARWQDPQNPYEEPDNHEQRLYKDASRFYSDVLAGRYLRFIERRKLFEQMMKEDAEGMR
jgi:hypothetical protein